MGRIARVVVPGMPHHVTQRGTRRQPIFFKEVDRNAYKRLLKNACERYGVQVWAYCLMENHVHLIVVPEKETSLPKAVGAAHHKYSCYISRREGWTGHLWQERFSSFLMDENYLIAAVRYVERNPVEAGLVSKAEDYPWSSARAHVSGGKDPLLTPCFLTERITDWVSFLSGPQDRDIARRIEDHGKVGLPLGSDEFIRRIEAQVGRSLPKKQSIHLVTGTKCTK